MIGSDLDVATREGLAAIGSGREEQAIADIDRALAGSAGNARAWQAKALLHRAIQDLAPAIDAFARAAALAPGDARIALGLAVAKREAGLPSLADFNHALGLGAGPDGLLGLVEALVAEGRSDVAIAGLERALAANRIWVPGLAAITHLRWEAGQADDFTQDYARATAAYPQLAPLWHDRIYALLHARQFAKAEEVLAEARAALGESEMLTAAEAAILADSGRADAADPLFDSLAGSSESPVQLRRVRHHLQRGRPELAAELAEGWTRSPDPDHFWPYLATAWRLLGDPRAQWLEEQEGLVGVYDISARIPDLALLAEHLRALHRARVQPLTQSLRGGTQTHADLFPRIDPLIQHLRRGVAETVAEHIAGLPQPDPKHPQLAPRRDLPVRFAGSWSVRLVSGGSHANHVHPKGWFSSALYIALPEGMGADDPGQRGWLTMGQPEAELGLDLAPFRTVPPRPGQLVLFPSTLWHGVVPFGDGERLTVAFDVARPPPAA